MKADPSKDDTHNNVLSELVQRSIPKKVFVLVSTDQNKFQKSNPTHRNYFRQKKKLLLVAKLSAVNIFHFCYCCS